MTTLRAAGFTLVEVLVALMIVALGMGALLAALGSAADNTSYLRDKTFAQWVALNRVTELRLKGQTPSKGKQTGETDFAGHHWEWEQEVSSLDVPGVMRIDVKTRIADTAAQKDKKAPWIGNAIGVMGEAIAKSISPLSTQATWESEATPATDTDKGTGTTTGTSTDTTNSSNNDTTGENDTTPSSGTGG